MPPETEPSTPPEPRPPVSSPAIVAPSEAVSISTPQKPHQKFISTLRKSALERWPELKPWAAWFDEEWQGMKKGFILFIVLVAAPIGLLIFYVTHKVVASSAAAKLSATNDFFVQTNSFLLGSISAKDQQINAVQKQLDDLKRDSQSEINGLKTDNFNWNGNPAISIEIIDKKTLTSSRGFQATPFTISTNLPPSIFQAAIDIFAPGKRGVQSIIVNFVVP